MENRADQEKVMKNDEYILDKSQQAQRVGRRWIFSTRLHTDAERKYAAKAARVRRGEQGKIFPTRLHTGTQVKVVSGATNKSVFPTSLIYTMYIDFREVLERIGYIL